MPAAGILAQETAMLHVVKMIQRRYPHRAGTILRSFVLASGSLLVIGIGLLLVA